MTSPQTATMEPAPPAIAPLTASTAGQRDWFGRALTVLVLLGLLVPPYLFGDDKYWLPLFTRYVALAIFALSVDLIWGYTGLLSLGQGLYFGMGAYALGYSLKLQRTAQAAGAPPGTVLLPDFMEYCRLPEVPWWVAPFIHIWLAIAVAVILPTLVATVFGLITFRLRIRDVFFSIITQALVLAAFTFVVNQQPYTGGVVGMTYLAKLELFGHPFQMLEMYYLVAGILVVCFLGSLLLVHSKFGRVLTAIRDNENRVLALGYNTAMYKTFIFAVAGGIAGLSGGLYVSSVGTTGPDVLSIVFSIEVVILVAVGGRGTLVGAIIGAILVSLTKTIVNDEFKKAWPIVVGSIFVLVVVFMPNGIIGLLRGLPKRGRQLAGLTNRFLLLAKRPAT
ncbi:MAG TPA: urea ABC transporter permease subunit UrtC [Gemmataceae bacterium]|nr:urea ABC transporter permease subunit UrtC [Gemmataceae bacterium]